MVIILYFLSWKPKFEYFCEFSRKNKNKTKQNGYETTLNNLTLIKKTCVMDLHVWQDSNDLFCLAWVIIYNYAFLHRNSAGNDGIGENYRYISPYPIGIIIFWIQNILRVGLVAAAALNISTS